MDENVPVKADSRSFIDLPGLADPIAGRSFQLSAYLNQAAAPIPTLPPPLKSEC